MEKHFIVLKKMNPSRPICRLPISTTTCVVAWCNLILNAILLLVFGYIIPNNHPFEQVLQDLCNQRITKLITVIKGMELLFSFVLLKSIYTGNRALLLTWIIAAASITGASLIVFPAIYILTKYTTLPIIFTFYTAFNLSYIVSAVRFYNFKQDEYDCGP